MSISWFELDLSVRFTVFIVAHVILFQWMRSVVAPAAVGRPRLLRAAPLLPLLLSMSYVFNIHKAEETIAAWYAVGTLSWQCTSKIWSFCLNRGQLVKSYDSGSIVAFALSLLLPVVVSFDEEQVKSDDKGKGRHAYSDARFAVVRYKGRAFYVKVAVTLLYLIAEVLCVISLL
mgnify:CR=1 FL=1